MPHPKKQSSAVPAKKRHREEEEAEAPPDDGNQGMPPLPGTDEPASPPPAPANEDPIEVSAEALADAAAIAAAATAATAVQQDLGAVGGIGQDDGVEEPSSKRTKRAAAAATTASAGGGSQASKRAENWNARFEELKAFKEQTGHFHLPKKDPLSQWARDQRTQYGRAEKGGQSTLTPERRAALDSIGFPWRLWTKKSWEERLADLQAFKDENGHCDVPIRRTERQSLATWVDEQRKLYRNKQKGKKTPLTDEREAQLEEMGFSWYRYGPTSWEDRIKELKAYKEKNGDCLVPLRLKNDKNSPWKRLANWVSFQRLQYKNMRKNKKTLMTDERYKELEEIGFVFSVKEDDPSSTWNVMLDELYRYKSQFNNCNVPADYSSNKRLAAWVRYLRRQYAKKKAGEEVALTNGQITVLEAMGFQWTVEEDEQKQEAGAPPIDFTDYFATFAQEEANEAAAPEYTGKAATGFARNESAWKNRLEELRRYKAEHDHTNVAWKGKGNADPALAMLGKWVSKQRSEYRKLNAGKKSQITPERIDLLNELSFNWSPGTAVVDWSVRLEQLKQYKEEFGHTNVPKTYAQNTSLGQWVQTQRVYYKKLKAGKSTHMSEERRQQLDDLGFQWTTGNAKNDDPTVDDVEMQQQPEPLPEPAYDADDDMVADDAVAAAAAAAAEVAAQVAEGTHELASASV